MRNFKVLAMPWEKLCWKIASNWAVFVLENELYTYLFCILLSKWYAKSVVEGIWSVHSPTCGPLSTNFLFSFSIDTPIYPIFYHWQNTKDICTVIFLPTLCTYILGNYQEIRVFSQRVKIYWSRQFDDQGKSPNFIRAEDGHRIT